MKLSLAISTAAGLFNAVLAVALIEPEPFQVRISDSELADFKALLKLSKISAPTYESLQENRTLGITHKWFTETKKYWEEEYDWRKSEVEINTHSHFKSNVTVEGVTHDIHFVGLFSENTTAIPLIMLHGWPGDFLEFLPILNLMKEKYTPQNLPYHLIVPSLPGYGFSSSPPLDRDFTIADISKVMNQLMIDLGYESGYVAQGGDIGSRVARFMAMEHEPCKAVHLNFVQLPGADGGLSNATLTDAELARAQRGKDFLVVEAGYFTEHGTKPSTIGLALGASPLALLAWIGEKWLDGVDVQLPLDFILESVTLYWFTESQTRGIYVYRSDFFSDPTPDTPDRRAPFGYSSFLKEIMPTPESWAATTGNLVFYREHAAGGHFAALEQPKVLMQDVEEFIQQVWKA